MESQNLQQSAPKTPETLKNQARIGCTILFFRKSCSPGHFPTALFRGNLPFLPLSTRDPERRCEPNSIYSLIYPSSSASSSSRSIHPPPRNRIYNIYNLAQAILIRSNNQNQQINLKKNPPPSIISTRTNINILNQYFLYSGKSWSFSSLMRKNKTINLPLIRGGKRVP